MLEAFSTPRKKRITMGLFIACGILLLGAIIIGIGDNPPGIALAYLSAISFILAWVHPFRTAKKFLYLAAFSTLAFIVLLGLTILSEQLALMPGTGSVLRSILEALSAAGFILLLIVCLPAILIGLIGALVMYIRNR